MTFLSEIRRLYRNLLDALRWANIACRAAAKINAEIQASNADAALKASCAAFLTSADALCASIQAYKDNLPGN